jgi:hypothetical protein
MLSYIGLNCVVEEGTEKFQKFCAKVPGFLGSFSVLRSRFFGFQKFLRSCFLFQLSWTKHWGLSKNMRSKG